MIRFSALIFGLAAALAGGSSALAADAGVDFFEKNVRPVLVEHCYKCHSAEAKKLKGNLHLDSREGVLTGGDSGPAIVPGNPDESRLIKAVRYNDRDSAMPPKGKLPDAAIGALEQWVKLGAPAPAGSGSPASGASAAGKKKVIDIAEGKKFWSYQPIRSPKPPDVKNAGWVSNDVDRFILAALEAKGLSPVSDAQKRALIRRVTFDLTGLPPTPEEIDAFLADDSQGAYERVVERLLGSKAFGERWGRHWLDVARFAESVTLRGFLIKDAWRYRDYVIECFNNDTPYDQFIREQIAGDLMPASSVAQRQRGVVATIYLAMGNANLEEQDKKLLELDVVDEQLDVIGKGILAQTITCARCHDHKFDPIPTRDYYGMAGILKNSRLLEHANVSKWIEVALPLQPDEEKKYAEADAKIAAMEAQVRAMKAALGIKPTKAGGAIDPKSLPGIVVDDAEAKIVGEWTASKSVKPYIGSGYLHDANDGKGDKTITFIPKLTGDGQYEVRLAYTTGKDRATNVHVTLFTADGEKEVLVNQKLPPPIDGMFVSLGTHRFEFKGQSYVMVSNEATDGVVTVDAVQFIPVDESLAAAAREPEVKLTEKPTMAAMKKLEAEAKELAKNKPKRPSVVGMRESGKCEDMPIHIRGSVQNVGDVVPRGFLQVASFDAVPTFSSGESGRRELAEWLASPRNPLTARVMTNRVWHWLFGVGLVRTTDNFGTTGEAPSHPELLDYLATQFIEHGWSVKHMVRLIVTSHTYRLSTAGDERNGAADPENRLLWRMNRRRLDAECLRDAMLTVSGKLEPCSGGQTFDPVAVTSDYKYDGKCNYRSVYVPVFRNNLPEIFEVFDFADPSSVTGARNVSTVAPQALYLRNHPFVIEQAGAAAKQVDGDEAAALEHAYQVCLGRSPTPAESKLALDYLARATDKQRAWTQVYQAIFASIDFRYLD